MIQHLHSLACARPIIDKNTGMASYVDIIEGINFKKEEKLQLPSFSLISKFWVKDGIEDNQKLLIQVSRRLSHKSKGFIMQEMDFALKKKGDNILIQLDIEKLVLEEVGIWELDVKWKIKDDKNWKKATSVPIRVGIEKG